MELHDPAAAEATLAPRPLPPGARDPWPAFLRTMAWVGLNTFGGPVAQIGFMHRVAVERRRWLSDGQFVHLLNFANLLPGPEALELCIHLGWLRRGVAGGIAAGVLFIWPGFVTLTALAWVYRSYGAVPGVAGFLDGVRPVAMALVAAAAVRISRKALKGGLSYALMAAAFLGSFALDVPFVAILAACGALGLVLGPRARAAAGARTGWHGWAFLLAIAAFVAGAQLRPEARAERAALAAGARGAGVAARAAARPPAPLAEVGWMNLKTALLTFGGAYTALPYLREQTVDRHGWLDDREVVDGLALGETTPGPLISIAVFLSFLAAGLPGAIVGGFFLFLPSFLLVLGLGRYVESIERLPRARDVLWGFSAGTLGLVVALAADLVPTSLPDPIAIVVALTAFVAVWRLDLNLVLVVLAGGGLGLLRTYL